MGVSGLFNRIVPFGNGFAIFYTSYQEREGIKVAYNSSIPDLTDRNYSVVTSSPVANFDLTDDGNGGYYLVLSSLWEKAGIDVYHFTNNADLSFVGKVTSVTFNNEAPSPLFNTVSILRDNENLLHIYYFVKVTDNAPSLREALFATDIGQVTYNGVVTSCEDNYSPVLIQSQWNGTINRPELVFYTYNNKTTASVIKYAYRENGSWHFTTVDSSENNGDYFLAPPAMGIDESGDVYVYYKRNTRDYHFRGILKKYTNGTVETRTFGEEMSKAKKKLFNMSKIVFNGDQWEIFTYQSYMEGWQPKLGLMGIYLDSGTPTTTTVESLDVSGVSPDFPLTGVLGTDAFIDSNGQIFISGWLEDLKGYDGEPFTNVLPYDSYTIDNNPDTHWTLQGGYGSERSGFNYLSTGNGYYFVGTGYNMDETYNYIFWDEESSSPDDVESGSDVYFYDSAVAARGGDTYIYILGRKGNDLYLWKKALSDSGFTTVQVPSAVDPVNGVIYVYENYLGIVYVDDSGNLYLYTYDENNPGGGFSSVNVTNSADSENFDLTLNYSGHFPFWDVAYVDTGVDPVRLKIKEYELDLGGNSEKLSTSGVLPSFYNDDDAVYPGLLYYDSSSHIFKIYWINQPGNWSYGDTLDACENDNLPSANVDRSPQLVAVPDGNGGTAYDLIYQSANGKFLMMGLQIKDSSGSCWLYNIPVSLISDSDKSVYRVRGSFATGVNRLRTGYLGFIPFRNTGTGFYQDIVFTR